MARRSSSRWRGRSRRTRPDANYDLHLNNGRLLEHFHEGNLTYRTEGIREKTPSTFVEVSPELAQERGIESGRWVELTSRYGEVRVQAVVTDRVKGKELYMPMNSTDEPVNRLTSSHTDKVTHTPAYKETSVQHEGAAGAGRESAAADEFALRPSDAADGRGSRAQVEARGLSRAGQRAGADSTAGAAGNKHLLSPQRARSHRGKRERCRETTRGCAEYSCDAGETRWRNRLLLRFRRAMRARNCCTRLENAPAEHAEALLDSYELLQQLHEARVFEVAARGV